MINALEALADCIMRFEGFAPPASALGGPRGSTSWRNRNPGNLRGADGFLHTMDAKGYCIFNNLSTGWSALLQDLTIKCSGKSKHNLTPQSTLHDLISIYAPAIDNNDPEQYSRTIAMWLGQIYNSQVTPQSTLDDILSLGPITV